MRRVRLWACAAGIAAASVAGGSAQAADPGLEWKQITGEETRLVFYAPGLQDGLERFYKSRDPYEFHIQEIGRWVGPSGRYPNAQIVLVELGPRYHFNRRTSVKHDIGDLLDAKTVDFREGGDARNVIGKIYYVEYFVETDKCLGFSQYFGWNYDHDGPWSEGNSKLFGYYCVSAADRLSAEKIAAILNGIGVKGEKVPEPPAWVAGPVRVPGPTEIVDCLMRSREAPKYDTSDFTRKVKVISTTSATCVSQGGRVLSPEEAKNLE